MTLLSNHPIYSILRINLLKVQHDLSKKTLKILFYWSWAITSLTYHRYQLLDSRTLLVEVPLEIVFKNWMQGRVLFIIFKDFLVIYNLSYPLLVVYTNFFSVLMHELIRFYINIDSTFPVAQKLTFVFIIYIQCRYNHGCREPEKYRQQHPRDFHEVCFFFLFRSCHDLKLNIFFIAF